jgi:hypothetical protein
MASTTVAAPARTRAKAEDDGTRIEGDSFLDDSWGGWWG